MCCITDTYVYVCMLDVYFLPPSMLLFGFVNISIRVCVCVCVCVCVHARVFVLLCA